MKRWFDLAGFLLVVAAFAVAGAWYSSLPDPMPSHWNIHGQVDGWMPKFWGVFLLPIAMAGVWLVFLALPKISPRGFEMEPFARAWGYLRLAILAFLLLVGVLVCRTAAGNGPFPNHVLLASMGLFFAVMGNFLGKVTRNFFVGIRTPWTIASEEVWYRTHRLAGKLFVAGGLIVAVTSLLGLGIWPILAVLGLAALVPAVYSYVIYRRVEPSLPGVGRGPA